MQPSPDITRLIEIIAALRTPGTGCAWDLEQTHETLAPYALEEAYEVVDAIERGDLDDLRDELGDLLLQVVFHARLAEEVGAFRFGDIVEGVTAKMVRRHPHVFAAPKKPPPSGVDKIWDAMRAKREARLGKPKTEAHGPVHGLLAAMEESEDLRPHLSNEVWETIKAEERRAQGKEPKGLLADVTPALPGMVRAVKLQTKAAAVGFDWDDARLVLAKIREEADEIEHELDGGGPEALGDEIGDLIFAVANLARHARIDPETAVRGANAKFERRFAHIETALAAKGSSPQAASLDEMETLWAEAKAKGL